MKKQVLLKFSAYIEYLQKLQSMKDSLFNQSIKKGKWSMKEIIAHLYRWDLHLLEQSIPLVLEKRLIQYPSYHDYNKESELYAKTIATKDLLRNSIEIRKQLGHQLEKFDDSILLQPIKINGYTNCPRTNTPYTLLRYIEEFVEHDTHHVQEMEEFLLRLP